jgi:hypothetical protein
MVVCPGTGSGMFHRLQGELSPGRRKARSFLGQGQEGIALGTADPAACVLAQEENHETEYEAETDDDGERYDGHGAGGLNAGVDFRGGGGNLGRRPAGGRIPSVAVAEHFLRFQPVVEVPSFRTTVLKPEKISRVLDLEFGGLARYVSGGGISMHGG